MIHILAMIYVGNGGVESLRDYESRVLPVLEEHGGKLLSAFAPQDHEQPDCPDEIHLIAFSSDEAFKSYLADKRVESLSALRRTAISRTTVYVSKELIDYEKRGA